MPDLHSVKLALLTPGDNFSGAFLECFARFQHALIKADIGYLHMRMGGSHVVHLRQNMLMGNPALGPHQRCFSSIPLETFSYTHILWIDSDMTFTFDDFRRLVDADKDVILGLFKINDGIHFSCGKWSVSHLVQNGVLPFYTEETLPSKTDLFETEIGGLAFTLFKAGIIEKLPYPWFTPRSYNIAGCTMHAGEDISLFLRLRDKGVKIWVDPQVRIGHEKRRILT